MSALVYLCAWAIHELYLDYTYVGLFRLTTGTTNNHQLWLWRTPIDGARPFPLGAVDHGRLRRRLDGPLTFSRSLSIYFSVPCPGFIYGREQTDCLRAAKTAEDISFPVFVCSLCLVVGDARSPKGQGLLVASGYQPT